MTGKEKRSLRIIEAAMQLAEKGGFAAVRLRDVATKAGVALGTVYKRFESKEELLIAALEMASRDFEQQLREHDVFSPEHSELERLESLFRLFTNFFCSNPNFARAVLRSVSSGEPVLADKVKRFHNWIVWLTSLALLGESPEERPELPMKWELKFQDTLESRVSAALQSVWFSALVGWSGGLNSEEDVIMLVKSSVELMLPGYYALKEATSSSEEA